MLCDLLRVDHPQKSRGQGRTVALAAETVNSERFASERLAVV